MSRGEEMMQLNHLSFIITGAVGTFAISNLFGEFWGGLWIMIIGGLFGHYYYTYTLRGSSKGNLKNRRGVKQ